MIPKACCVGAMFLMFACSPTRVVTGSDAGAGSADASHSVDSGTTNADAGECIPQCRGRDCGANGCGNLCGYCPTNTICREDGQCVTSGTCTPTCYSRSCGDDGCGGSCGECAGGETCTGIAPPPGMLGSMRYLCEPPSFPTSSMCPPTGTQGKNVGDVIPEMPLTDCASHAAINFRGVCTQPTSMFVRVNIDCSTCIYFVNTTIAAIASEFPDLDIYIVLSSDSECGDHDYFTRTDYHFVREYLPQYGFTSIFGTAGNDQVLVLHEGNRIALYENHPEIATIRAALTTSL